MQRTSAPRTSSPKALGGVLARNWARFEAKPPEERRIAIIVADPPNGDGVRLDTANSAANLLAALRDAGYRVEDAPQDGAALKARLVALPTTARPDAEPEETLSFATYSAVFAGLPMPVQQRVSARWGAAERDPLFRLGRLDCGRFAIPGFRCGNVAVVVPPAHRDNRDPKTADHDTAPVPPHSYLSAYAWVSDEFRADAVIDLGDDALERPPGEAPALSGEPLREAVLGPMPHLDPSTAWPTAV